MTKPRIGQLSTGFKNAVSKGVNPKRKLTIKPNQRDDGELYARPEPNPFTPEWCRGYDDGIEGRAGNLGELLPGQKPGNYWDGFHSGEADRQELDVMGSSNA